MENEIFKDVKGFEGLYKVSNFGNVLRLEKIIHRNNRGDIHVSEMLMKPQLNSGGYLGVGLQKNKKKHTNNIHQLVAEAFLNHNRSDRKIVVDHIDKNKLNNRLSNLQIISQRLNCTKDMNKGKNNVAGVHFCKERLKFTAKALIANVHINLGRFNSEKEASNMYQCAISNSMLFDGDKSEFRKILKELL